MKICKRCGEEITKPVAYRECCRVCQDVLLVAIKAEMVEAGFVPTQEFLHSYDAYKRPTEALEAFQRRNKKPVIVTHADIVKRIRYERAQRESKLVAVGWGMEVNNFERSNGIV